MVVCGGLLTDIDCRAKRWVGAGGGGTVNGAANTANGQGGSESGNGRGGAREGNGTDGNRIISNTRNTRIKGEGAAGLVVLVVGV